jgi:hypothetical protein
MAIRAAIGESGLVVGSRNTIQCVQAYAAAVGVHVGPPATLRIKAEQVKSSLTKA